MHANCYRPFLQRLRASEEMGNCGDHRPPAEWGADASNSLHSMLRSGDPLVKITRLQRHFANFSNPLIGGRWAARIHPKVRTRQYVMTLHAAEEMDEDGLTIFDVERGILTGKIYRTTKRPNLIAIVLLNFLKHLKILFVYLRTFLNLNT